MTKWRSWHCEDDAVNGHKYFPHNKVMHDGFARCRIERITKELVKGDIVLDAGCNDGEYGGYLKKLGYEVYGIDCSELCIGPAQRNGLNFTLGRLEATPYGNDFFDVVVLMETLEHLWDPKKVAGELHRIIKTGGRVLGSVPHPNLQDLEGEDYHLTIFTPEKLKAIFSNFKEVNVEDILGGEIMNHNKPQHLYFKAIK